MMKSEEEIRAALDDLETLMEAQRAAGPVKADVLGALMFARWTLGDTHLAVIKLREVTKAAADGLRAISKKEKRHRAN